MGMCPPGTKISDRTKRQDPPRSLVDKCSQAHDLRYYKAKTPDDIRIADQIFLRAIAKIKKDKSDSVFNILQGEKLIKLKMALFSKGSFGDLKNANTRIMSPDMTAKLNQLTQEGYGKKR